MSGSYICVRCEQASLPPDEIGQALMEQHIREPHPAQTTGEETTQ